MSDRPLSQSESDLVEQHAWIVSQIVDRLKISIPPHINADDLRSAGVTGLINAARAHDADRSTFSSYAAVRIRGAVLDELRRQDWCPRRVRARLTSFHIARRELEQKHRREMTVDEVCASITKTKVSFDRMAYAAHCGPPIPLDARQQFSEGESTSLAETIQDETCKPAYDDMQRNELLDRVAAAMSALPQIQRKVLVMSYFEGITLGEIGVAFGLTDSRISQIRQEACQSIRKALASSQ